MSLLSQSEPRSVGYGRQALPTDGSKGWMILQNVNGFTSDRAEEIKAFLGSDQGQGTCAIMLLTELNVDWRRTQHSLAAMVRSRIPKHVVFAHNTTERGSLSSYQPGGVAIISFGAASARVIGTETDSSGLGRWCSVQFQLRSTKV